MRRLLKKGYNGIIESLYYDKDENLILDNVCEGTCIDAGTYEHYISRKRIQNDLHGSGAFLLMCAEMYRYFNI